MRMPTRSTCGALTSMPSIAQKSATARAASVRGALLAGRCTELGEIVLKELDEPSVFGEGGAPQRLLRLVVVVGGLLHELRDGLRRRGRRGAGRARRVRRARTGYRLG